MNPNNLGDPSLPSVQNFPGYLGFRDALDTYMSQAGGMESQAAGHLAGAEAIDPLSMQYQNQSGLGGGYGAGGRGLSRNLGLYSGLIGGNMVGTAQGQGIGNQSQTRELGGVGKTYSDAANAVYNVRSAREQEGIAKQQQNLQMLQQMIQLGMLAASFAGGAAGGAGGAAAAGGAASSGGSSGGGFFQGIMNKFSGNSQGGQTYMANSQPFDYGTGPVTGMGGYSGTPNNPYLFDQDI